MAGQRQPTDLVVMNGRKHLTKAEIEARKNAEVTAPCDKVRPPCIMDGVLSSVLAEVRSEAKIELINSTNTMMTEKNEELEKAKKAAKRVLKTEPDEEQEQDTQENPEE